jgi:hypothetical protein
LRNVLRVTLSLIMPSRVELAQADYEPSVSSLV